MPYKFTFDLSRIPRFFFTEVTKASYQKGVHKKVGKTVQKMIKKFRVQETTGLNVSDAVLLLQDLIDMQARNLLEREKFVQTRKRALFLPHCSRKYMDSRCKAVFNSDIPSYVCAHCSSDCSINKAVSIAERKGYDVYILPGSSCVPKILKTKRYEGVVGVACGEEIKMSGEMLKGLGVAGQAVPLIKNGCSNTAFNIETLVDTL
jgi:hypothetical protein